MQEVKSMGLMHTCLYNSICRKIIVEGTVRLKKHFR